MSKQRYLDTKFWSDGYIEDLDPVEKLLFLYLLTNERTNVAGIYELPRKIMSVETGIEKSMLDKIIERFENDGKVKTYEKWIRLVNSDNHQNLSNSKIQIGRNRIIDALSQEVKDNLYMTHTYVSNNLDPDLDLDLDSDLDYNKTVAKAPADSSSEKALKVIDANASRLATDLLTSVKENYSFVKVKEGDENKWAADIEKINRIDGYDWGVIEMVLKWSQADDFWKQNIRSGSKFRQQFERLLISAKAEYDRKQKHGVEII